MTDQSPSDIFKDSSVLQGHNAVFTDAMRSAGIVVADSPAGLGEEMLEAIG